MRKLVFAFVNLSLEKELLPWRFMISARQFSEKKIWCSEDKSLEMIFYMEQTPCKCKR